MNGLGSLAWYTIREVEMTREQIRRSLQNAHLDEEFLPKKIFPADAFRRATRDAETRRLPQGNGTFINLLIREVHTDSDETVRHLVRETVDARNRRLDYEQVAQIRLDKKAATCHTQPTQTLSHEENETLREVVRRYGRYLDAYQGDHLRRIVHEIVHTMNPVAVRPSGGVYFIPAECEEQLIRLQAFVNLLGGSTLWTMPVLDSSDARAVIRSSLGQEVEETAKRVVSDLARMLQRKGEVSEADQRRALGELHQLQGLTSRYEEILEDKLLSAKSDLDAAVRQVRSLLAA